MVVEVLLEEVLDGAVDAEVEEVGVKVEEDVEVELLVDVVGLVDVVVVVEVVEVVEAHVNEAVANIGGPKAPQVALTT